MCNYQVFSSKVGVLKYYLCLQESDGEKSDQDLVVDVANEVSLTSVAFFFIL